MPVTLTDSPADILRWLMIQLELGVEPSTRASGTPWPIVVGLEPTAPDDCVTIKNTAGTDDGRTMVDGVPHAHFGIQIRVRSVDERVGWSKISTIRTTLATRVRMDSVTVPDSGEHYTMAAVTHIGQILPIGKESPASKRNIFTLNVTLAIVTQP